MPIQRRKRYKLSLRSFKKSYQHRKYRAGVVDGKILDMAKYIIFTADVQKDQVAKLRNAITEAVNTGESEIYLAISSGGGNVFEGLSISALIKSLPIKVTTHNIGQIDSVANAIYAAGSERFASANSSFLFHGVSMNLQNPSASEHALQELYENIKRFRTAIATATATYVGIQLSEINDLMTKNGGSILSASEAVTKTIVHKVVEFNIPQGTQFVSIGNA